MKILKLERDYYEETKCISDDMFTRLKLTYQSELEELKKEREVLLDIKVEVDEYLKKCFLF